MSKLRVLYRYWRDDTLLYVGRTSQPANRNRQHELKSEWWELADKVTFEHFATQDELERAEQRAIVRERPLYNVHHNVLNTDRLRFRKPVPLSTIPTEEEDEAEFLERVRASMNAPRVVAA